MPALGSSSKFDIVLEIPLRLRVVLARHEIHSESILDSKNTVIVEIIGFTVEYLRRQRLEAFCGYLFCTVSLMVRERVVDGGTYNEMNMSGPVLVSVEKLQELAGRAVHGYRVRRRAQAVKGVFALGVCDEDAAEVMIDLLLVLLFV